MTVMLR